MIIVDGEEYLTVEEATGLLGVKPATLYAYVSRGVLRSYRQGIKRQRLYRRAEVEGLVRLAPTDAGANAIPPRARARRPPIPARRVLDPRLTGRPGLVRPGGVVLEIPRARRRSRPTKGGCP